MDTFDIQISSTLKKNIKNLNNEVVKNILNIDSDISNITTNVETNFNIIKKYKINASSEIVALAKAKKTFFDYCNQNSFEIIDYNITKKVIEDNIMNQTGKHNLILVETINEIYKNDEYFQNLRNITDTLYLKYRQKIPNVEVMNLAGNIPYKEFQKDFFENILSDKDLKLIIDFVKN